MEIIYRKGEKFILLNDENYNRYIKRDGRYILRNRVRNDIETNNYVSFWIGDENYEKVESEI